MAELATVRPDLWPPLTRGVPVSPLWASQEFEDELALWCRGVLDTEVQLSVAKLRSWSAVWRVESDAGVFYAKQNCPGQAFEAALMQVLDGLSDRVVPTTAVDLDRGFLLTPDQGPVMRETVGEDIDTWCAVAREAALLQRDVMGHLEELELAGARRLGAAEATTYVVTRLEEYAALPEGDQRRIDPDGAARLRGVLPQLDGWVDQVLAVGLPVTLNHGDLHSNNVFALESGPRFFDFGDSLLSEPLCVLLATLNSLRFKFECPIDDPRLVRVADAAIEVWSDLVPAPELRAALPAFLQLGKLARSESWARCLSSLTDEELDENGDYAAAWLLELAEPLRWSPRDSPQAGHSEG